MTAKRGYSFPLAGALFMIVAAILGNFLEKDILKMVWLFGMASIFPLGVLLGRLIGFNVMTRNPLGVLGGLVGGLQGLFLPIWIFAYVHNPEYLPLFIGVLGGAHFLPYCYIYRSKAYLFMTMATVIVSVLFGYVYVQSSYITTPIAIAIVYLITVYWIQKENSRETDSQNQPLFFFFNEDGVNVPKNAEGAYNYNSLKPMTREEAVGLIDLAIKLLNAK
jgi:hypothetical protein